MLCLEIFCIKGLTSSLGYTFIIGLFHPVSVESVKKKKGGLHSFLASMSAKLNFFFKNCH